MTQTLNIKYFYIQNHKELIFSLPCFYHRTYPYLLFLYNATISKNLAPTGLIPSQLTSRPGWSFTYNVSGHATHELNASKLTLYNSPPKIFSLK